MLRFGIRAFFVGLVIGVLFAPRAGAESRRILRDRFVELMDSFAELLALPEKPIPLPERTRSRGA